VTGLRELAVRGIAWAADYAFVLRWQARSLLNRRPAWSAHRPDATEIPVVLLPGIFESWRFLEPLGKRLAEAGHPIHVVPLGLNHRPVAMLAGKVATAVATSGVDRAVVVAHSKGGQIGKQLMLDERRRSQADGSTPRIAGMVTVNTPFGGSSYARLIPLASVRAMSPTAMHAFAAQRSVDAHITSIYASWDPHIPEGGQLTDAVNLRVPYRGHFRILGVRAVQDAVLEAVERFAVSS
jgi:pimeloyl-ACP methyl ester carboxylesterase